MFDKQKNQQNNQRTERVEPENVGIIFEHQVVKSLIAFHKIFDTIVQWMLLVERIFGVAVHFVVGFHKDTVFSHLIHDRIHKLSSHSVVRVVEDLVDLVNWSADIPSMWLIF